MKPIYIDIDQTICRTDGNDYQHSEPIPENIAKINKLYDSGEVIIYWTVRGRTSGINWYDLTKKQLLSWGCKFHRLDMNSKPDAKAFIDDICIKIEDLK
jgi:hypothetical protein